eukprot:CAMPEP_0181430408 /NCGR_PEP_ID=MMETSP1110-20121109/17706_1 /TAXON_ID=174948 /ORGANISM="Symbiodinium sp., Strain CCMP421" /LENGTH=65 /DNA_ID=CAMNT_0023553719 /DNA_START=79 /DNA_END=273 /DNA_ORIENTATION=-
MRLYYLFHGNREESVPCPADLFEAQLALQGFLPHGSWYTTLIGSGARLPPPKVKVLSPMPLPSEE